MSSKWNGCKRQSCSSSNAFLFGDVKCSAVLLGVSYETLSGGKWRINQAHTNTKIKAAPFTDNHPETNMFSVYIKHIQWNKLVDTCVSLTFG